MIQFSLCVIVDLTKVVTPTKYGSEISAGFKRPIGEKCIIPFIPYARAIKGLLNSSLSYHHAGWLVDL